MNGIPIRGLRMQKHTAAFISGIAAAVGLLPAAASATPGGDAGIRALEASFAQAVAAKDLDAVMKVYAPDIFVFDVVPPRQYVGAPAYREDWKGVFEGFAGPIKFEVSDLAVTAQGSIGYSHSIQHMTGTDPKGVALDVTVRVTDVYRKIAGKWLIVQEHVSVPVDLGTLKPDLTSKP